MLHLWLSEDRKQNTEKVFTLLCENYKRGRGEQILLVPEQFSHITQQAFCKFAGDRASCVAQILDFTRLSDRVFAQEGGVSEGQTDAVGQLFMMSLAVEQVRSRLKIYALGAGRPEFLLQLLQMLEEFRSFCVTPMSLRRAAEELQGVLAQKAEEFALLMESYDAVCENCGQNPKSRLTRLLETLQECGYGQGKEFLLDGFTDFNGIQLEIILELLRHGAQVHIFLQCDDIQWGGQQFQTARDTAQSFLRFCAKEQIPYDVTVMPCGNESTPLRYLRKNLFSGSIRAYGQKQDAVVFLKGNDALSQYRAAAGEILRLVSQGARWRDITIACNGFEADRPLLASVLSRAGIPAYFAGDMDILRQPATHMLLSALEAAAGYMEQEAVLSYLKSGFSGLSRERCDQLENYILLWNINATRFEQPWRMNPRGMDQDFDSAAEAELEKRNEDRELVIVPLLELRRGLKTAKNTGEMVLAFYDFFCRIGLEETLRTHAEDCQKEGDLQRAQEYVQLYGICCGLLEQMYGVLGSSIRSPEEFHAIFRAALSVSTVGTIPARLDCVNVGSLMSQRRGDTHYLFLLGANEGSFPGAQENRSLLTDLERGKLMSIGLGVAPTAVGRLERELAAMDSVLGTPSKRLYLGAVAGEESYFLRRTENLFPDAPQCEENDELVCRSRREYLEHLAAARREDAAREFPQLKSLLEARDYELGELSSEAVQALYGKMLRLSSTKINTLAACGFSYFLKYGLRARERKTAKVDPTVYGTFVHNVLEHTARQVRQEGGFHSASLERVLAIARRRMEDYTENELSKMWPSARAEYLFRRNFAEIELVVKELYEELSRSDFEPRWFELHFSDMNGQLPSVKILGEKSVACLEGYVDRTDIWQKDDKIYVRVVDYKTGREALDYTKILHGLGMQMLLYLFALVGSGERLLNAPLLPAGVLYFPARVERVTVEDKLNEAKMEEKRRKHQKRTGLVLDDEGVLQAMEPCDAEPLYLPYGLDKEGQRKGDLATGEQMSLLAKFVFGQVAKLADGLYSGKIDAAPYFCDMNTNACAYCPYHSVCRENKRERWLKKVRSAEEFWKEVEQNG